MEIYRLDHNYKRVGVVDEFESFVWTERYADHGEFELVTNPSVAMIKLLKEGGYITHTESERVMIIENILKAEDAQGSIKMTVSGRSLETILDTRVLAPTTGEAEWTRTGTPGDMVAIIVRWAFQNGIGFYKNEAIPTLSVANNTPAGLEPIDVALRPQSVYTAVKEICDSAGLGFRISLLDNYIIRFRVWKGSKRSNVVFSSQFDNLSEESYFISRANWRNIAVVWAKDAGDYVFVAAPGTSLNVKGLNRRVMSVDASDLNPAKYTVEDLHKLMKQRGKEALAKAVRQTLFDGKLTNENPYKYGVDYYLGDTVILLGEEGQKQETVVTEYIWAWDQEGLRSYPTFKVDDEG